jgi:hypothetical protein
MDIMRKSLALLLLAVAGSVSAQTPPNLEPIADPPAPVPAPPTAPPTVSDDSELEPQVTIKKRGEDKVEEYRLNGKIYMIKVTPPHGVPYYLIDERGDGNMSRHDNLDSGLRPPMWVIKSF